MLKNSCKVTGFDYDSHDCYTNVERVLQEGWLATREGYEVSLAGLFQHICLPYQKQFLQRLDYYELNLLESYYENEKGFFNFTGFILRRDSPSS